MVFADPLFSLAGFHEREGQGAEALLGGQVDGLPLAARHPERRVGALVRLGQDVARGHLQPRTVPSCERFLDHHPRGRLDVVQPLVPLGGPVDAEAVQLCVGR